jgi:hypothetical protein
VAEVARKFGITQSGLALVVIRMEKKLHDQPPLRKQYASVQETLSRLAYS